MMVDKCDIFLNLSTSRSVSNSPGLLLLGAGSWGADAELGIVLILASLQTDTRKALRKWFFVQHLYTFLDSIERFLSAFPNDKDFAKKKKKNS